MEHHHLVNISIPPAEDKKELLPSSQAEERRSNVFFFGKDTMAMPHSRRVSNLS
jgi:hypothetical protein